ncbi:hypothetical protein DM860_004251 [Cuscuta australis]|uniref:VAN3-binding protein-like auxin canalisation domain-containing protein n=1 Tax=Cuscuta australis TaxID=267555 RepID=A0A328E882_9ASTE|nr:hypothetical protein DM860_004251 [Cuscuta australis]
MKVNMKLQLLDVNALGLVSAGAVASNDIASTSEKRMKVNTELQLFDAALGLVSASDATVSAFSSVTGGGGGGGGGGSDCASRSRNLTEP